MTAVIAITAVAACSPAGFTRQQVKDGYRARLVAKGVTEAVARCITDGFFDPLSDVELRSFQGRGDLTPQESETFQVLGSRCGA